MKKILDLLNTKYPDVHKTYHSGEGWIALTFSNMVRRVIRPAEEVDYENIIERLYFTHQKKRFVRK